MDTAQSNLYGKQPGNGIMDDGFLRSLFLLKDVRTRREASWDRTGGNRDWVSVAAGETAELLKVDGPGCITHIYWTMIGNDPLDLRRAVLRMYWDGQDTPSVEVPLGDFFGAPNCIVPLFASNLITINPGGMGISFGFNCYFPMPFSDGARITLENESSFGLGGPLNAFWYHIEYEEYDVPPPANTGRFHAQWRRECLTKSAYEESTNIELPWDKTNLTGDDNYVILDAEGHGQIVGLVLNVDNVAGGWWGEGDDMIFIDGERFPPRYHGTGTEEIFGGGASPNRPYFGPYTGYATVQNSDFSRNTAQYRWFIHDPIRFRKSVKFTIEHGHANTFENDYSSVAYWYQTLPAKPFPPLPPAEKRLPLPATDFDAGWPTLKRLIEAWLDPDSALSEEARERIYVEGPEAGELFYRGQWGKALTLLQPLGNLIDINL